MYLQPPVGDRTRFVTAKTDTQIGFAALDGWGARWFGSGTEALAAALTAANRASDIEEGVVAVAAYGCPDLVAAIHFAGLTALYIDLEPERLTMDLSLLADAMDARDDIVAIIGVDLFGLPENGSALRDLSQARGVALVQDCAQSLQPPELLADDAYGDFLVFSFGRGKPVYLQGGGAVLTRTGTDAAAGIDAVQDELDPVSHDVSALQMRLYDIALHPTGFALASMLLGDRIGITRYEPLEAITRFDASFGKLANRAIAGDWARSTTQQQALVDIVCARLDASANQCSLPFDAAPGSRRLLRLPVLAPDPVQRSALIDGMRGRGIAATAMYEHTLPDILSRTKYDCATPPLPVVPVAQDIAARLVTLPVHRGLKKRDFAAVDDVLGLFAVDAFGTPESAPGDTAGSYR